MTADRWGAENRFYSSMSGLPGKRDPNRTPFIIPWIRAADAGEWEGKQYRRFVLVCSAQVGKTEGMLDLIGSRLDQRPAHVMYVGPNKEFNLNQFEPRLQELFQQAPRLGTKLARGKKEKKTLKIVSGARLRLAHAGSSVQLKSDPAVLALVDEYEEFMANIRGQGDPLGLIEARGDTYADFISAIASTCSRGTVEVERDPETGLEYWKPADPEDIESPIWRLWQQGTMFHWAWPCPHCRKHFVPRFRNLAWVEGASATRVKRRHEAWLQCPSCSKKIFDEDKEAMNAAGVPIAKGQRIVDGKVIGEPPDTDVFSLWVSGLCSPFKTFGDRAAAMIVAEASGSTDEVQTVTNAGFGELYTPGGGRVPDWQEVLMHRGEAGHRTPRGTVPDDGRVLTCGIDVQTWGLVFGVRAWGARASSWLIDHGELKGPTAENDVWTDLSDLLQTRFDGLPIKIAFIDSGFRPGKVLDVPENKVYQFCRLHQRFVFPTKGYAVQKTPIIPSDIEVTPQGKGSKFGLKLFRLSTDHWKSWVHERIHWPMSRPGAWYLHAEADEQYARQIVSEARILGPSGTPTWVRKSRDNHYLDVEALNAAAGYLLGAHRFGIKEGRQVDPPDPTTPQTPPPAPAEKPSTASRFSKWAGKFNQP